ncbi:MAG TPA: hypothetical protein VK889_08190 [Solirubrobacterales bacterium]|nr:hypothetical protein [Solirubrobacterales bacterium]
MAATNPTDCPHDGRRSPAAEDQVVESGVLGFVLDEHPAHLTIPELSLAINSSAEDFSAGDAVERAIRDLVGGGLLQVVAGLVLPTRAALCFHGLEVV